MRSFFRKRLLSKTVVDKTDRSSPATPAKRTLSPVAALPTVTEKTKGIQADTHHDRVQHVLHQFEIPLSKMKAIVDQFVKDMENGLDHEGATVAMIPSFVSGRPSGKETGRFLALDLGGTYLRVCEVDLKGNGQFNIHQQKYMISDALKTGDIRHLCDFMAECVDNFITGKADASDNVYQLGFTFSFPVLQTKINRGTLKQWTKGFSCDNAVNKDVVMLVQDAFLRKNLPVHVAALVNDTVGTLMALAYRQPETTIGVILGTGTNACYYEQMSKIKKWKGDNVPGNEMIINMEWGAFDCERRVLPMTPYDNKLDRESINPRQQIFEKMISGMYLGEIARNAFLDLIDRGLLFGGYSSTEFNTHYSFETAYMSTIQNDTTPELDDTRHILEGILNLPPTTFADRTVVQRICGAVGQRAARLSACGLAAVITHCNGFDGPFTVGVDGSVYEHYPKFEQHMKNALVELFGAEMMKKISFALARDGSGLGAAIVAMISQKTSADPTLSTVS